MFGEELFQVHVLRHHAVPGGRHGDEEPVRLVKAAALHEAGGVRQPVWELARLIVP